MIKVWLVAVALTLGTLVAPVAVSMDAVALDGGHLKVPNLIGKTADEAIKIVKAAGFVVAPEQFAIGCDNPQKDDGKIRCQTPAPGEVTDKDMLIQFDVYVNTMKDFITEAQLASLHGMTVDDAKAKLGEFGFRGTIKMMAEAKYDGACTNVCDVLPFKGVFKDEEVEIYVNPPHRKISAPAPQ